MIQVAFKIDVDTEIGTRIGVPNLLLLLKELNIPATFYLSIGPDNTGRAIKRIFRPGFLKKIGRTNVISNYGIKTLLNGVLIPGPHIGKKHFALLQNIKEQGFPVGIHSYDHQKWQDGVMKMSFEEISAELQKARDEFTRIFNMQATTAASPGWQANSKTLQAYDDANLIYASDCRGISPFFPKIGEKIFNALQIPTTLPTLDELLGRPEFPLEKLTPHYLSLLKPEIVNVMTIHPEIEGMKYLPWFREFLLALKTQAQFTTLENIAQNLLQNRAAVPVCELIQSEVDGRSGSLAMQA